MKSGPQPHRTRAGQAVSGRPANPARLGVAVLLILGGGLVFLGLYRARGHQVPVLVMAHDVPAGQAITDRDLSVADVAATGVETVPAKDLARLKGTVAKVALTKGAILTPQQFGTDSRLAEGDALVALAFAEVAVPRSLHNEDNVGLVVGDKLFDAKVTDIKATTGSSGTMSITFKMKQDAAKAVVTGKDVRLLVVGGPPSAAPVAVLAEVPELVK